MNASSPASYELFLRLSGAHFRKTLLGPLFLVLILLTSQAASAATYTVTNTLDSGIGSLRDALASVNAGAGGDVIAFSGVTGTITLSNRLAISKNVIINGPGANQLTVSGNDAVQVFSIATATTVSISGLTIAHGYSVAGAGIGNAGTLTVNGCVFSNNVGDNPTAVNVGGAIQSLTGTLTVNNSTFLNNRAIGQNSPGGGAIYAGGTTIVNNSTFFGNSAFNGGAITAFLGNRLTVANSTIVGNSATGNDGGINITSPNVPTVTNSIVSGNTGGDCSKCTGGGNNLIGGTATLGPLQYNGGPTPTMMPLSSGTGIFGAGLNSTLATDQRGFARPTSGASDLGAVETYNMTVTTTDDSTNGGTSCTAGDTCSLRDAITLTNSHGSGDIVTLTGLEGTITLGSPLPDITADLNIAGPGANLLTISGGNASGVFNITNPNAITSFSGVTIANGTSSGHGGGIRNNGLLLTLSNCALSNNSATGAFGGGFANENPAGSATVTDCTFSGNRAQNGGGIFNTGFLWVSNSTVVGNSTIGANAGGGLYNSGSLLVTNSTLSGNSAGNGGGITNYLGTATIINSIVAGNTDSAWAGDDCNNCGTQSAFNLISIPSNIVDPLLGPLTYNGLNQALQTVLPLPGSPAIQMGDPTQVPADITTDERLLPRTTNSKLDLGAVQTNYTSIQFVQQPSDTTVNQIMSPAVTMSVTESGTTAANIPLPITFAGSGALHGTVTATTQAPAIPGDPALASFGGQSGDTVGTGDTLASSLTVTPAGVTPAQTLTATSDPFDITALTPTTVDFSPAPPTSVVYGSAPVTLNGTANASGTPTGQIVTYQVISGPGSIAGNTLTFAGVGTVAVTATTTATGSYAAGSTPVNIVVTPAPLTITIGNATRAYGAADPAFTSTATGLVNGDTLGSDITLAYSTTATAASPAGSYSIMATLSGAAAANYIPTIVHGTLTITAVTSVPLVAVDATGAGQGGGTPGSTTPAYGDPVPVTVTVPTVGGIAPTGTVTVYVNGNPAGTGTLGPNGTVTVIIPGGALPVGTNTITVGYSGDGHYGNSTSAPETVTVAAAMVLDFSLTQTSPPAQTVISGSVATFAIRVAPTSGIYPGVVTFTATGLPPGATATFAPATVAANAGPVPVNLSVQTASLVGMNRLGSNVTSIALGLFLLPFLGAKRKRLLKNSGAAGRYVFMIFVLIAGAIGMAGLTGCGNGNGFFGHAPKTYDITITATSGTIQHSVNATLNVQ